ncbi:MAG: hypothetical protein ACREFA_17410, partial [Stellaceae bacterium]
MVETAPPDGKSTAQPEPPDPRIVLMNVPLAWRLLSHDKRRTALAIVGIFLAIALVFLELGLFFAVPRG